MWTYIIVVLISVGLSACKPDYRQYIPNGFNVPNPCRSPNIWNAVGHYNPNHHTIIKNKFGWDFIAANKLWTNALCKMDSDNDGKTNGEELGDPDCKWMEGDTPQHLPSGHPGLCEPVGGAHCYREQGFQCDCKENCPDLKTNS